MCLYAFFITKQWVVSVQKKVKNWSLNLKRVVHTLQTHLLFLTAPHQNIQKSWNSPMTSHGRGGGREGRERVTD